ncbi:unnamed protein product [Eruca vesicaria subsp. sativa]|uniref:DJ-1/PfpI domain-containing protein n=1 Tax=Eruca vesicaria subsp. sativa TaxID=29727 RepID=A0ABC8L0A3_ERUVS|nr:unnamed protein product [Eruca vesicaria subsp. sativa]
MAITSLYMISTCRLTPVAIVWAYCHEFHQKITVSGDKIGVSSAKAVSWFYWVFTSVRIFQNVALKGRRVDSGGLCVKLQKRHHGSQSGSGRRHAWSCYIRRLCSSREDHEETSWLSTVIWGYIHGSSYYFSSIGAFDEKEGELTTRRDQGLLFREVVRELLIIKDFSPPDDKGGMPGPVRLRDCAALEKIMKRQAGYQRLYGAISMAPAITFLPWGILTRKKTTRHLAFFGKLPTFFAVKTNVQISRGLTTRRGPGTSFQRSCERKVYLS